MDIIPAVYGGNTWTLSLLFMVVTHGHYPTVYSSNTWTLSLLFMVVTHGHYPYCLW